GQSRNPAPRNALSNCRKTIYKRHLLDCQRFKIISLGGNGLRVSGVVVAVVVTTLSAELAQSGPDSCLAAGCSTKHPTHLRGNAPMTRARHHVQVNGFTVHS